MTDAQVSILGCGYTGRRVAARLLARGYQVVGSHQELPSPDSLSDYPNYRAVLLDSKQPRSWEWLHSVPRDGTVLYSIPSTVGEDVTPNLLRALPSEVRIVYLSTTGVYGTQPVVNERTPAAPATDRTKVRVRAEEAVRAFPNHLILRPAAIYGPGRGAHAAIRAGTFQLGADGANYVSRIHVDDLAALVVAGLLSGLTGAWPVADEEPCTSREIAQFCANLLGKPLPPSAPATSLAETRRADRRVNGAAIRQALGITLRYPTYREGIPACIAAEAVERAF